MPTASRLVAAICLGLLAIIVSGQVTPLLPEGRSVGPWFTPVNVIVGMATGWGVMGPRAGRGRISAVNNGVTGVAAMVFWAVFVHATDEMVHLAMRNRYDGPFEAILAILYIGIDYARLIATIPVIAMLLAGGVAAGLVTEYAKGRWR